MAVKASRVSLTHTRRLRDPEEPVGRLMDHARHLGPKLGPALPSCPRPSRPTRSPSTGRCGRFRPGSGSAVATTAGGPTRSATCWAARGARCAWPTACAAAPRCGAPPTGPTCASTRARPTPCPATTAPALAAWAGRLADLARPDADAYVYFNNDPAGCAVRDAIWFAEEAAGPASTRPGSRTPRRPRSAAGARVAVTSGRHEAELVVAGPWPAWTGRPRWPGW